MNGLVKAWLDMAATDLALAKHDYETFHPMPCNQLCERSHLTAELAIKAVIYNKVPSVSVEKTHDLFVLVGAHLDLFAPDEKIKQMLGYLNQFAVKTRYPNELQVDEGMTKVAIGYAEQIFDWAKKRIDIYDIDRGKSL